VSADLMAMRSGGVGNGNDSILLMAILFICNTTATSTKIALNNCFRSLRNMKKTSNKETEPSIGILRISGGENLGK
jgi:hypothetical protein